MSDYKIKQLPEDFIVKEESSVKLAGKGKYDIFKLKKREYTTEKAVQQVADSLHIDRKRIGYAGSKDSKAITEQSISIHNVNPGKVKNLNLKDIKLEFIGYSNEPISLGDLEGNSFEIVVRGISKKPKKIDRIINYFGEQRFSTNNAEIGKAIIKKDFKKAVDRLLESIGNDEKKVIEHLQKNKNDFVGALKEIPWKTLNMYIHAYQSKLWNETVEELVKGCPPSEDPKINSQLENNKKTKKFPAPQSTKAAAFELEARLPTAASLTNPKIPIIGFASEIQDKKVKAIVDKILQSEYVKPSDFVIRAIPDLSSAGNEREMFVEIKDLNIGELEDDELNNGKKKVKITFSLGKGSYATEVVNELFS
jgi:tRNA pseudouridine13 synthase